MSSDNFDFLFPKSVYVSDRPDRVPVLESGPDLRGGHPPADPDGLLGEEFKRVHVPDREVQAHHLSSFDVFLGYLHGCLLHFLGRGSDLLLVLYLDEFVPDHDKTLMVIQPCITRIR